MVREVASYIAHTLGPIVVSRLHFSQQRAVNECEVAVRRHEREDLKDRSRQPKWGRGTLQSVARRIIRKCGRGNRAFDLLPHASH